MTARALATAEPPVRVVARASPFRTATAELFVPAGRTVAELVEMALPDPMLRDLAQAWIVDDEWGDPHPLPRPQWHRTRPKPGMRLFVAPVPQGGGGNKILRAVLTIAIVIAATIAFGPNGTVAASVGSALGVSAATASAVLITATTLLGSLLINALLPVGTPRLGELSYGSAARTSPTLSGSSNQARPWRPIPRIYGRHRVVPPKAARDSTESEGETTWLRCLFDFGYGPLELSEMRIGAVPIEQFEGVEIEVRQGFETDPPVTLYTDTIRTDGYSIKVSQAGGPQTVQSRDGAVELGVDLTFQGLVFYDNNGNASTESVGVRIEYRPVGAADWTLGTDSTVSAATASSYTASFRFKNLAPARYELRVTRTTFDTETSTRRRSTFFLTQVRSVLPGAPVRAKGRCLVALRIRATDQLNGTIQDFSAVAQALLPVWDGTSWTVQATRNPAWAYLDVLRGRAIRFPVADTRIALADFLAWANRCDTLVDGEPKQRCDLVVDARSTVFDTLRDIAGTGRATPGMRDGRFSIVEDLPTSVPVQHFTPRNSWGFRGTKIFAEPWHGLRVRFVDPDRDWEQGEVIVYADGYTEANATRVDTLDLLGCTSRAQAMREGRYHLAAATLRPETYELTCDVEHLVCTRGDLVRVSHDVPLWGSGWGRVRSRVMDGPNVAGVLIDEPVPIRADRTYALRWRGADTVGGVASVSADPGEATTFTFASPLPPASAPDAGDLVMVGEAERETAALKVKSIEPGPNLTAKLVLVDAAPEIHDADTGPIPAFDPLITLPYTPPRALPGEPVVVEVFSGTAALLRAGDGSVLARIGLRLRAAEGDLAPAAFQVRGRIAGTTEFEAWSGPGPIVFSGPVFDGTVYELQARAVSAAGLAGPWSALVAHTVAGKAEPPADVAGFVISGRRLDWQAVPDLDLAGYRIRWAPGAAVDWQQAQPAHGGLLTSSPFELDALPAGQVTVLIKAIDTSGNESAAAARIVTNLGAAPIAGTEAAAIDFRAGGFAGTKVNATVASGDLLADADATAPMWLSDLAAMWGDPAAEMFPGSGWLPMEYLDDIGFTDPPPGARVLLRTTIEGAGQQISYRITPAMWTGDGNAMWTADGNPMFGAGVSAEWLEWPGALVDPPGDLELRVMIAGGAARGAIRRLVAVLDAPRIDEALADIALAAGGTRLPIAQPYRGIGAVTVTLQGGTTALGVRIIDKDPDLGPLVRAFDTSGTGVAATVDAVITGY
jgi:hypothetical protein